MDRDKDGARWRWGEERDRDGEEGESVVEGGEKRRCEEEQDTGSDDMHLGFYFHLDFPREKI